MPRLLHHILDEAALRRPESTAASCDGRTLTYEALSRRASGLAHVLRETGLTRGERAAVLLGKGLDVPAAFYGVLAAGAVLVPIDPKSPVEQVVRVLRATGATRVVTEPKHGDTVARALADCPDVSCVIGLERDSRAEVEYVPWASVSGAPTERPPHIDTIALDPAYVLHTSGSTGTPKLIQHTHASALSFVEWAAETYALTAEDRLTNHSSHHTCFATFDYYAAARAGAATIILTPSLMMMPASLSRRLEEEHVSVWYSVPTALVQLSLRGDLESRDLSSLRWVLFAGETFPRKHLDRIRRQLPGARFSHVYGSTETNVCTYYHLPDVEEPLHDPLPIGKACSNASTVVVDETLRTVPDGEMGELLVRGATVMSGYWGDPEKNREALVRLPSDGEIEEVYFRTGDQVRVLDDGTLAFVARTDRQVKVRGNRLELEEIERALLALEAVEEAAVFAVPDGEGSSALKAAVVVGPSGGGDERALRAGLKALLPPYALPETLAILAALPRTPTGKVDRNALRDQLMEREEAREPARRASR